MINLPKVRYAVFVAVVGLAVALIPGLTDTVTEWIRALSLFVGALWSILRVAQEFVVDDSDSDPMVFTQGRGTDSGFWQVVRRAL